MSQTLTWQLAWRYLRGKRSGNAVPILSRISMVAIAVASGAMVVLLSVFNGFEHLVADLYKAFYPSLKITAAQGKFFSLEPAQLQKISTIEGITAVTTVLEDNVLVNSDAEQRVASIKGIDRRFSQVNDIKPYIVAGVDTVSAAPVPTAILGLHIANEMGADVNNAFSQIVLYYPNGESSNLALNPQSAFQTLRLKPDGIFRIQDEFDTKYILAPLPLVQDLLQANGQYSSVEISFDKKAKNEQAVKTQVSKLLGNDYAVATRFEQNKTLYMVMRTEKWAVYAILCLVLLIASFNMVGALSLLVLEKKKDMAILKAMGATVPTIRSIFIIEGILWTLTGGLTGGVLGLLLCLGQQQFGWVQLTGSYLIEAYPVRIETGDLLLVVVTLIAVGCAAAWYPALKATRTEDITLKPA